MVIQKSENIWLNQNEHVQWQQKHNKNKTDLRKYTNN